MKWNYWIRQIHRWLGVAFTVTVLANVVVIAAGQGEMPPLCVTYLVIWYVFICAAVLDQVARQATH
jgi:hypothetical protein